MEGFSIFRFQPFVFRGSVFLFFQKVDSGSDHFFPFCFKNIALRDFGSRDSFEEMCFFWFVCWWSLGIRSYSQMMIVVSNRLRNAWYLGSMKPFSEGDWMPRVWWEDIRKQHLPVWGAIFKPWGDVELIISIGTLGTIWHPNWKVLEDAQYKWYDMFMNNMKNVSVLSKLLFNALISIHFAVWTRPTSRW